MIIGEFKIAYLFGNSTRGVTSLGFDSKQVSDFQIILPFTVSEGFTDQQRLNMWEDRRKLYGNYVEVEYQLATGTCNSTVMVSRLCDNLLEEGKE